MNVTILMNHSIVQIMEYKKRLLHYNVYIFQITKDLITLLFIPSESINLALVFIFLISLGFYSQIGILQFLSVICWSLIV